MAVAVHVGIGVRRHRAWEIQSVFPSKVEQDGLQDEDPDDDAVTDELVRHHGLHEHGEQRKRQHLREGDDEQLLDVLQHLVVVVADDGLHQHAHQHRDREQNDFDERNGRELRQPVGPLGHRQRIVDAVEVVVALAPDQFRGVQRRDDDRRRAWRSPRPPAPSDRSPARHSDPPTRPAKWPLLTAKTMSKPTIAQKGISRVMLRMRSRVSVRYCAIEVASKDLPHPRQLRSDERANRARLFHVLQAGLRCTLALGARGQRFDRHREECPQTAQRDHADASPEQSVVEKHSR